MVTLDTAKIAAWFTANMIKIVIAGVILGGTFFAGAEWKETRIEQNTVKGVVKQAERQQKQATARTKEAFKETERIQELERSLAATQEKLNAAIRNNPKPAACDMSDDEFVRFNELAKQASRD